MSRPEDAAGSAVLVIEDDEAIGRHLQTGLRSNGYETSWCRTGYGGLAEARRSSQRIILLDLGLPDLDGIEVARSLRAEQPDLLIIILTARDEEIDIISGLDAGADDYLVKPFNLTVLLARLRAHLRRRPSQPSSGDDLTILGDLTIDHAARRCLVGARELHLRHKEFELLAALAVRQGVAVPREDLMAQVWDENWYGSTKTLDVTMAALRRRLSSAGTRSGLYPPRLPTITTLRGHGYRLEPPP